MLVLKNIEFCLLDSDGVISVILEVYWFLVGDIFLCEYLLVGVSVGLSCVEVIVVSVNYFCEEFFCFSSSYL